MSVQRISKNLRGHSFKGQRLVDEDFSDCDIRGADFSRAVLVKANFSRTRAGQTPLYLFSTLFISCFLAVSSGYVVGWSGGVVGSLMMMQNDQQIGFWSSLISIATLILLVIVASRRGIGIALGTFSLITAFFIVLLAALGEASVIAAAITQLLVIAGAISGAVLFGITIVVLKVVIQSLFLQISFSAFLLGNIFGMWEGIEGEQPYEHLTQALPVAILITGVLLISSLRIGFQAEKQDKRYLLIYKAAKVLSSFGGTNFRNAILTDADFTEAHLSCTDFRQAILKRTCWFQAKKLEQARLENTYLEDKLIRRLVVLKDGVGQHFEYRNLQGLNLNNANLKDAFFTGANLSESTLENANLAGARLAKAQFYQSNLRKACLTGAYIENWGISTDTILDYINCKYVFMHLPTDEDPDPCRKPDNRQEYFKEGDFTDFIAPIIKTLDLYQTQNLDLRRLASQFRILDLFHYEGIDPSAAAIAIQQVSEKYPEAQLEVIALEGRGHEKIRLQAKVARDINRSKIHEEYFAKYSDNTNLSYSNLKILLAKITEKDERIKSLEKILAEALEQPKFYVETYQNQGEFIMTQENKGNVSIKGVQGNVSGVAAAGENQTMTGVVLGQVSDSVTNIINQLESSSDSDQIKLKDLLSQLQEAIEAETELSNDDKVEALEQIKVLADSGQNPKDGSLKKAAKTSMKILKGTISTLPDVTKLVQECSELLPAIITLLALV